jgi:hypothetical protein
MISRCLFALALAAALGCTALCGGADERQPVTPRDGIIKLFNGRDLTGWHTWLKATRRDDPHKVFTVHDGRIHVSGEGLGYIATDREYRDYHLVVEYKWGKRTDGGKYVRNSGILLHAVGPDGGANGSWMSCFECQLAQGCVGDIIPIRGRDASGKVIPVRLTSDVVLGPDGRPRWKKGGKPRTFSQGQLWWNRHDPDFKEFLDTRGKHDVESPLGEWTRVECVCADKRIRIMVNGTTVNEAYDVYPSAGRILLQCEGFEVYFRKAELHPLKRGER